MATVFESLKSLSGYPVPQSALIRITVGRGLAISAEATASVLRSQSYRLAEADLMKWLAKAPNVSQGGVSYSFSESEREQFKAEAEAIYEESGEGQPSSQYGYQGENL